MLRLVPTSALPADIAQLARINIAAALDLFGPRPQDQYRALDPVRARLRGVLTQAPDMPLVLFDACRGAVRITQGYLETQSIPEPAKDPLIAEFLRMLRETALDIVNNDPRSREVLDQRREARDATALFEARDAILSLADATAAQSEGELQIALPEDAGSATNPQAEPEVQRESAYRLFGRLLRVGIATGVKGLVWVGGVAAGLEVMITGLTNLALRPEWQMFLKAAWRFLGLA